MRTITVSAKNPAAASCDALVVAVADVDGTPTLLNSDALPKSWLRQLTGQLAALGITGKVDEVRRLPSNGHLATGVLVTTGVGAHAQGDPETLRRAAGAAARECLDLSALSFALPTAGPTEVAAVAEGAALGAYRFEAYRDSTLKLQRLEILTPQARAKDTKAAIVRADQIAEAVHRTRDLVNLSPAELFPEEFANRAKALLKGSGVKVSVLDARALREQGYGGLTAVGQGSPRGPRLVKLVWSPARAARHVALVGKGITFDSGGLSLKPPKSMETMKSDMAGAASVFATVAAAAALKLPIRVTGWLALAENMPSGAAQRPSDVITMKNGTTVEVLNTDAEGRLVLADALVVASAEEPDSVLDIATLTGAQVVALGSLVGAVMGSDEVREAVVAAANNSGEQFWPMPLPRELRASLDSKIADICNIGDRNGGMLTAGLFLQEFVGSTPWAHLDIAGPSFNESAAHGYTPQGGTGMGVRTLLTYLEAVAAN